MHGTEGEALMDRQKTSGRGRLVVAALVALLLFEGAVGTPTPAVAEEVSASPNASPSSEPTASASPSSEPTASASPSPTPSPSAEPTASPSVAGSPSGDPSPSPDPEPSPQPPPGEELVALRTANSRTFVQQDGSYITEFYTSPLFYQPDGTTEWQPIDLRFAPAEGGVAQVSNSPARLTLAAADSADGFLRLEGGGYAISFALPAGVAAGVPGTTAQIAADGRFADYADFLAGGIGLRVFARADGFKSFLVLPAKPLVNSFTFAIDAPGLTLALEPDGGAAFRDAAGKIAGRIPRPFMVDSSDVEGRGGGLYSEAVTLSLASAGALSLITLTIDQAFLDSAVYPVYVDPSTTTFPTGSTTANDTFASSKYPNSNFNKYQRPDSPYYYEMWHGNEPGTTYYNEVYIRFNSLAETLGPARIDDGSLQFYPYHQYYDSNPRPTWAQRIAADWKVGELTWNNRPTTVDDLAVKQFDTQEDVWSDFDLTAHVQDVVTGGKPNHGVMLHANGTGQGNWKRIVSRDDPSTLKPKLIVSWTPYTVTPAYPTGAAQTSSRTLSWTNDLGGPLTWYQAQVSTVSDFSSILVGSGEVNASALNWTIPASTALSAGTTYYWRVRAKFGSNVTWTAWSSASFVHQPQANLGLQAHNTFESFELGNGDSLSVNVATGNAVLTHPLVDLPYRGGSLPLALYYNSHDASNVGMGAGWRLNVMRRLAEQADGSVVFTDGDGARHTFTIALVSGTVTTYNRPPTIYATLRKDTAVALEWTLTYRDLGADHFDLSGSQGLLAKSADRHGNAINFSYYSGSDRLYRATDPASRYVEFSWDTSVTPARLTQLTDWGWVSGGVVQAGQSGARRLHRFLYDAGGQLLGWANPENTSSSCPVSDINITCLEYASGLLTKLKKRRWGTLLSSGSLVTSYTDTASQIIYSGDGVAEVRDAQQVFLSAPGTTFRRVAPAQIQVVRQGSPASTTTYGQVGSGDSLGRIASVWRRLGTTDVEQRTVWDAAQPIEPASVTQNYGAKLSTPARTVSYTYVSGRMGLVARMTEPLDGSNNRTTDYTYNANNDVTQVVVALNGSTTTRTITRYCYAASGCDVSGTALTMRAQIENYKDGAKGGTNGNADDVTTDFLYANGQLARETRWNYDAAGNLLDSRAVGYTYDANGHLTSEIINYADGQVTGGDDVTPNATTNARTDLTTVHTYDTAGNRISTADARRAIELVKGTSLGVDDYVTRWTYHPLNLRRTEKTPTTPGITITCASTSPNCRETLWTYNGLGQLRWSRDFGNLVTASHFDHVGRTTVTYEDPPDIGGTTPAVQTSTTTYDAAGRAVKTKDQRQQADSLLGETTYSYDELGRQTKTVEASGSSPDVSVTTTTSYDALDRQTQQAYGGQATIYRYDLGGRVTEQDDSFACSRTSYDYRDLALTVIEGLTSGASGCTGTGLRTLTNTYDGLGRLTESKVTAGEGLNDVPNQSTYDAAGNTLSSASVAGGVTTSTTYTLNPLDQPVRETRSDNSISRTNFDPAGNATDRCYWASGTDEACKPVGSSFTNPPTRLTTTNYDARNQRIELIDAATEATTVYDPDHNYQVSKVYLPTGSGKEHQSIYLYDERHRLASITHQLCTLDTDTSAPHDCSSTSPTGSDSYAYDVNDNRIQVLESNGAASSDRRYCYDAQNRLQYRNTGAACGSTAKDESYIYDAAGNRTQTAVGATITNFAYNPDGQLCKVGGADCTGANVTYDSAGRTRSWNGWFLSYDGEGRLVSACKDSNCATSADQVYFSYDGEGRRTELKTVSAAGTTTTVEFRYQGASVVEEHRNGSLHRQFLVDETGAIVKLIVPSGLSGAGTYLVTWNGHGDALALHRINADGTLTLANSYTYSSWGAPTTATHNSIVDLGFRFLYVGQFGVQWDNQFGVGLHYMQARHYAPALGRFIQPDPSRAEANVYAYAGNNAPSRIDPSGRFFWMVPIAFVALRVAAAVIAAAPAVQRIATAAPRMIPTVTRQVEQLRHIYFTHTWWHAPAGKSVFLRNIRWDSLIKFGDYGRFERTWRWTNGNWTVVNTVRMNQIVGYEAIRTSTGMYWYQATDYVTYVWRNGMLWTMYPGRPRYY